MELAWEPHKAELAELKISPWHGAAFVGFAELLSKLLMDLHIVLAFPSYILFEQPFVITIFKFSVYTARI